MFLARLGLRDGIFYPNLVLAGAGEQTHVRRAKLKTVPGSLGKTPEVQLYLRAFSRLPSQLTQLLCGYSILGVDSRVALAFATRAFTGFTGNDITFNVAQGMA